MSNITTSTTIETLISLGLIKSAQIEAWNKKLDRQSSKAQDSEAQTRANQAVACYIGATYKEGERFRKKPIEKALLSSGISRAMIDKAIAHLVSEGCLVNNADSVNNQTHTRHWRPVVESDDFQSESDE